MDKRALLERVVSQLESDRKTLAEAAMRTYEAATHEESEAEDQYDTRGLEASYLAGAQARRVAEIDQTISACRFVDIKNYSVSATIGSTALVDLESEEKTLHCFILPKGGGLRVRFDGKDIQVVTPQSPLGEALIGRTMGDVAVLDLGHDFKEYEITGIA